LQSAVHQHQRNDGEFGRLRGESNDVRYQGGRTRQQTHEPQKTQEPQSSGEVFIKLPLSHFLSIACAFQNWRQYVNRVEPPVSRPSVSPLPVPSLLDRAKLDEIGSSFESLLKEPVGHLDWSSEVEHELERRVRSSSVHRCRP
jgi:hypothetical protein